MYLFYIARHNIDAQIMFYSPLLAKILRAIPGRKTFGLYRFLPIFFVYGALMEFTMIKWRVGNINFCMFPQK